ncbi:MAG: sacsin N-terminal ATP-binding-like domain-containing protein [Candidatus Hydrogenedentales bacterium]
MDDAIKAIAQKRRKWVEANKENNFEAGLKRLLADLYPDNAHFIYELLQNAEDARAVEVQFSLHDDRIEFEHDGKRLFSIDDVDAITSIGFSTKRDDATSIGKFGVGFKAVFAYTETPEIESGEFHFRIRDMVVPDTDGISKGSSSDGRTRFILPFDNPKKSQEQARSEIEKLLKALRAF